MKFLLLLGAGRAAREPARPLHDSRTAPPCTLAVDAGFTDLASCRTLRLFDGPAVFFCALFEYIDEACTEIRQRPS